MGKDVGSSQRLGDTINSCALQGKIDGTLEINSMSWRYEKRPDKVFCPQDSTDSFSSVLKW